MPGRKRNTMDQTKPDYCKVPDDAFLAQQGEAAGGVFRWPDWGERLTAGTYFLPKQQQRLLRTGEEAEGGSDVGMVGHAWGDTGSGTVQTVLAMKSYFYHENHIQERTPATTNVAHTFSGEKSGAHRARAFRLLSAACAQKKHARATTQHPQHMYYD